MRCLFYAIGKYFKEGGYILIRGSKFRKRERVWFPHFLHMTRDHKITHMVPIHPKRRLLPPLWFKGKIKEGDG